MKATVAICDKHGERQWCIIFGGRFYPFGSDNFGRELAEWAAPRLESGKDNFASDPEYRRLQS